MRLYEFVALNPHHFLVIIQSAGINTRNSERQRCFVVGENATRPLLPEVSQLGDVYATQSYCQFYAGVGVACKTL